MFSSDVVLVYLFFFFQAEDGIRDLIVTGVQTCALPISSWADLASYRRLERAGRLTLRVALYLPLDEWRAVADTLRRAGSAGEAWVKIGGLKGYMDGSAGSRAADFFQAYTDPRGYSGVRRPPQAG